MIATILSIVAVAAGLLTALFIWKQVRLLRTQNQLLALIQLSANWNSNGMSLLRYRWAEDELRAHLADEDRNLDALEPILEFLEEFAGLRERRILDDELVWDSTIGWHAARYYFYNHDNGNVGRLRAQWQDATLCQNLAGLWRRYLKVETAERGINEQELIKQVRATRQKFLAAERNAYRPSESTD
jgi:hypothetical protein